MAIAISANIPSWLQRRLNKNCLSTYGGNLKQNYSGNRKRKEETRRKKQEEKRNKRFNKSHDISTPETEPKDLNQAV